MRPNKGCSTKMSAALENIARAKMGAAAARAMAALPSPPGGKEAGGGGVAATCISFCLHPHPTLPRERGGALSSASAGRRWEWTFSEARLYLGADMFPDDILEAAAALLASCRARGLTLATAESCTGGLVAAALTAIPGSSDVVERGFVTYSNLAKSEMLGVPADLIARVGAVSEAVARAMAEGALAQSRADIAIAVTGIAGPGGGSAEKPVGLVHIACARRDGETHHAECRFGDVGRDGVREASLRRALEIMAKAMA